MLLNMVLLANNDCATDSFSKRINRPFYWILLKEANLFTIVLDCDLCVYRDDGLTSLSVIM